MTDYEIRSELRKIRPGWNYSLDYRAAREVGMTKYYTIRDMGAETPEEVIKWASEYFEIPAQKFIDWGDKARFSAIRDHEVEHPVGGKMTVRNIVTITNTDVQEEEEEEVDDEY